MRTIGAVAATLFMAGISLSGQAQKKDPRFERFFKVQPEHEQIDASMNANTVRANLRDNPEELPESIRMEMALNEVLTFSRNFGLPKEDVTLLTSTNRTLENGARVFTKTVTKGAEAQLEALCEAIDALSDAGDVNIATLMEMKNRAEEVEEEDAQAYWRDVISGLSRLGQDSFASTLAMLGSRGDIDISSSKVNWVGFGAEQPTYALELEKQGCKNRANRRAKK